MKHVKIIKKLPPTYFYSFLVLSIILHFIFPIRQVVFPPWSYLGIFPIILGIFLNIWTDRLFNQYNTTVKPFEVPTPLVISGPFKISRHPMYLGMVTILIGISLIFGSLIIFLFPLLFFLIMELLFVPYDEKKYGENF